MKARKVSGSDARLVLQRMVLDGAVLGAVADKWTKDGLFASRAENLLGGWAVKHYGKYGKPPGVAVAQYYDRWAERQSDDDVSEFVSNFLRSLSDEAKKNGHAVAADFALDVAQRHFDAVRIRRMHDESKAALEMGDVDKARELVEKASRPLAVSADAGFLPFGDMAAVKAAIESRAEVLFKWGNEAMDKFFKDVFARDTLVAFRGRTGVGKSFWVQEVAFRAFRSGRKVAFFEVGDQSKNQIVCRFAARAARRPFKEDERVLYPVGITPSDSGDDRVLPTVRFDNRSYEKPITTAESVAAMRRMGRKYGDDNFHMIVRPNRSVTVRGLEAQLDRWHHVYGFVPDVVAIDYADILAPFNPDSPDSRGQINETWMALRAMSERWHCCVVTATQSDAAGYDAEVLTISNFNNDRRINDHCVYLFGIMQKPEEKENQLYRINCIKGRDVEFSERLVLWCASCLPCANPCVLSCF